MSRLSILVLLFGAVTTSPATGDDREPERLGVTLSEWIRRLDSGDVGIRNNAASVLIGFGEAASPATSALARHVAEDENPDVRRYAALALGGIGPKARDATTALSLASKTDKDPCVRVTAARSLVRVNHERSQEAVEALAKFLPNTNAGFDRINAIEALAEIGEAARKTIPELKKAVSDPDSGVSSAAKDAIKRLTPPTVD